jgi:DNA helicase-2/ATP-dependent DNA helicase PcrA
VPELRPNVRDALRKFAALVDGLRERTASWPPAQVLEQLIQELDYEAMLLAEGPEGADRWENVRELVASAGRMVGGRSTGGR